MERLSSRRSRNLDKQSKKQFYISVVGIIVILFLFFRFGLAIIGDVASFVSGFGREEEIGKRPNAEIPLTPPLLDDLPEATDKQTLTISGTTSVSDGEVEIFVNERLKDTVILRNSNTFETELNLVEGENVIQVRITQDGRKGELSGEYRISYLKDKPKLEISSPSDLQTFKKEDQAITVKGTTQSENTVTVNDLVAIVDSSGTFSISINLVEGENQLKIAVQNPAGVKEEKTLTVKYEK